MRQWKKTRAQKQKSRDEQKSGGSPARGPGAPCGPHARFLPASDPAPVFVFIARGFFIVSQRFPGPQRGIFGFKNNCGFVFFWPRINRRRKKLEDPRTRERGPSCAVPIPPPFCAGFRSGPPSSCASFRPRRPPAAAREAPRGSGPRGSRTRPLRGTWRPPPAAPRRRQPHPRHLRRGGMNGLVRVGAQARACSRAGCRGIGREAAATLRTQPGTASQAAAALVGRHPLRYGSLPSSFRYPAFCFPPEFKWAPCLNFLSTPGNDSA